MPESFPEPGNKNWAIAIVHGVGTPDRGQTMQAVCTGIKEICSGFVQEPESGPKDEADPRVQLWKFPGGQAKVAEAFWGDLSLVRDNYGQLILALCTNLYGAVYVHSRMLQKAGRLIRWLPVVPFYLLRWIILPAHLLCLLLALPFVISGARVAGRTPTENYLTSNDPLFLGVAAVCAVAGLVIAAWLLWPKRERVRPRPWDVAAIFALFAALSATFATSPVASWFKSCVDQHAKTDAEVWGILWGLVRGVLPLGQGACKIVIISTPIEDPRVRGIGKYIAVNELVGDIAFFIAAAVVLIYLLMALAEWAIGRRDSARAMFFVTTVCMLIVVIAAILLQVIDFITRAVQFSGSLNLEAYWYELGYIAWLVLVAAGAAASIIWRKRTMRAQASAGQSPTSSLKVIYARLIISRIFQFAVISATLVFIVAFLLSSALEKSYGGIFYRFDFPFKLVAPLLFAVLMSVVIFFKPLRLSLDIAMDVVNHFVDPRDGFPVRRSISTRFYDALDTLTEAGEQPHLLVIAHSQGSVIAVDALVNEIWTKPSSKNKPPLKDRVSSMMLLTFGSQLTHIYEYYFPDDYRLRTADGLQQLAKERRVRWINVFRADDPVGTFIAGPSETFPLNMEMTAGGHVAYWLKDILGADGVRRYLPGGGVGQA